MGTEFSGRCLCGAIRFRATSSPFWMAHCHCESCRRATASPFTSYLGFAKSAVEWTGQRVFHRSSPGVTRGFCGTCGTPMSYMSTRWPGEVHVFAATLEDPSAYRPTAHVHWAEKLDWVEIDDDLPKHSGVSPEGTPAATGETP